MPDINITVAHKVAVSDTTTIVCDNSDYMVHWTLDEDWSAYDTKTMRTIYMDGTFKDTVFSGSDIALPVCTVPGAVQIGLFAGDIRASRMAILRALPSVRSAAGAPADPAPDVYDQLMEIIKGLGGVDPEAIKTAVAEYLAAHPIEETDPTVPAWAKAETKPTYSAAEVGAIAQSDLQVATNAALALAKSSGEFDGPAGPTGPQGPAGATGKDGADGKPGVAGTDGVTPHIGDNGNWYIGSTDTGKPSRGTAGAGASDAQVSAAVSTWLTDHPEATTTVQDGAVTDAKLSDDLYKQVLGDERHKLTEVEVTPIPQNQVGADWVAANFDGSEYKVVTTFFTPLAKTPRYIKVVNKTSTTTINLRSGYTKYRFANGADESAEGFAIGNAARNLQFFNDIQIAPGETLLYDLQEFGRKGCEYFQFIISPAAIGGAYADAQFAAKLREQAEFYYVYDSYAPTYSLPDDSGEFLIDLPVRYVAQGINRTSTTRGFAVVPYYPDTTYNVRGGVYDTILVNALPVLFLLDDAIFDGRDKGITFNSGDCGHIPLIIGSSTTQYDTSVNGGADSKYQWAYVKTPPASELVGPKYVAIPMLSVNQDDATDKGEEYYKAIFDAENEKGPQNTYITRFSKQIPRSLYAQLAFPNPNYHDDGSKYYAMLTSASKSPLVGASWVLFGDSLTDNYGGHDLTGNYFATKIAREFSMSFDNRAKSGSNIYRGGSGNYTSVSGMIKLDEFTAEIDAGTTEQPDYITIAFGTNSFTAQLGTNADTSATDTSVYGATKRFIEVLREKCPKSVFGFVLSPKQNWGSSDPNNLRAVDAARTAIKAVCDDYGVPYIDMSTQSGITAAMLPDGIHISNEQSQNLYYHAMRRFMIGL